MYGALLGLSPSSVKSVCRRMRSAAQQCIPPQPRLLSLLSRVGVGASRSFRRSTYLLYGVSAPLVVSRVTAVHGLHREALGYCVVLVASAFLQYLAVASSATGNIRCIIHTAGVYYLTCNTYDNSLLFVPTYLVRPCRIYLPCLHHFKRWRASPSFPNSSSGRPSTSRPSPSTTRPTSSSSPRELRW